MTPNSRHLYAPAAADVRAICAKLGIDRLAMWGISGGGPHLLACAALLPGLVTAAASRIPGVEARLLDDDGHLTLETNRVGEVHAWLADHL